MGVPAFYKWLTLRYPNIVIDAKEPLDVGLDIDKIMKNNYIDSSMPDIDNLYLDMNGIIHPCSHPVDRESPKSIQEMYNSVFDYVDKVVRIIRQKQLKYGNGNIKYIKINLYGYRWSCTKSKDESTKK